MWKCPSKQRNNIFYQSPWYITWIISLNVHQADLSDLYLMLCQRNCLRILRRHRCFVLKLQLQRWTNRGGVQERMNYKDNHANLSTVSPWEQFPLRKGNILWEYLLRRVPSWNTEFSKSLRKRQHGFMTWDGNANNRGRIVRVPLLEGSRSNLMKDAGYSHYLFIRFLVASDWLKLVILFFYLYFANHQPFLTSEPSKHLWLFGSWVPSRK